jgi:flagellar protein FlbD
MADEYYAGCMIRLTRLNRETFYLNPDLIQEVETTPDTVVGLTTGTRIVVLQTPEELIEQVIEYKRRISKFAIGPNVCEAAAPADPD